MKDKNPGLKEDEKSTAWEVEIPFWKRMNNILHEEDKSYNLKEYEESTTWKKQES